MAGYGQHADALQAALVAAFNAGSLSQFTYNRLSPPLRLDTETNGNFNDIVHQLLAWAEQEGRERELVTKAAAERPAKSDLQATVRQVLAHLDRVAPLPWYTSHDPFETCFVRDERAFVDRACLRENLRRLDKPKGLRTMVVNGERRSGRSYSLKLIEYLGDDREDLGIVPIDLSTVDPDYGPDSLARRIALRIGRAEALDWMPKQQAQAARWSQELADWLVPEFEPTGKTWWIVVDHVDRTQVRSETLDLLLNLALAAESTRSLRLVLIGWSEPMPQELDDWVCHERVAAIERGMVRDFFVRFADDKRTKFAPGTIDRAVTYVMNAMPDNGEDRLKMLGDTVADVARALDRTARSA
jgi:hypothetical protein